MSSARYLAFMLAGGDRDPACRDGAGSDWRGCAVHTAPWHRRRDASGQWDVAAPTGAIGGFGRTWE